jgi:hypothetical protein
MFGGYIDVRNYPDGNNVDSVYHGPVKRSAPSVVIEAGPEARSGDTIPLGRGPRDPLRAAQIRKFELLADMTSKPVRLIEFRLD